MQRPDLIPPGTRTVNMVQLAEALHGELPGPPVRALFVYNSNPAAIAPDQKRVLTGLKRDDLFTVVHEQFLTDTTDYADIVLPATTQLEHFDLHTTYGHHYLQVNVPAIAPLGEAKPNSEVFRRLAGGWVSNANYSTSPMKIWPAKRCGNSTAKRRERWKASPWNG